MFSHFDHSASHGEGTILVPSRLSVVKCPATFIS